MSGVRFLKLTEVCNMENDQSCAFCNLWPKLDVHHTIIIFSMLPKLVHHTTLFVSMLYILLQNFNFALVAEETINDEVMKLIKLLH